MAASRTEFDGFQIQFTVPVPFSLLFKTFLRFNKNTGHSVESYPCRTCAFEHLEWTCASTEYRDFIPGRKSVP